MPSSGRRPPPGGTAPPALTDAEAIVASVADPRAFAPIFERHFDAVFGYFVRRVPRPEAADLASETLRIAFGARARFDPSYPSARPWLYGFAGNVLRHHLRARGREDAALRRLAAVPADGAAFDLDLDGGLDAARRWPAVAAALATLPPEWRDAVLLLAWEDLTYPEIAVAQGVPVGTVRSRIHRARARLRELIDEAGQLPDDTTPRVPKEASDHA